MKFPIDSFPKIIRDLIGDLPRVVNSKIEYGGLAALWAGSIVNSEQKIKVQDGWVLNTNIFASIVAPKGDAKTPALNMLINPLQDYFNSEARDYLVSLKKWENSLSIVKASRSKNRAEMIAECEENRPKQNWWGIVTDGTVEGLKLLAERHHENDCPPRIGFHSAELDGWVKNMNRYTDGGGDKAFWLQAFDGESTIKANKSEQSACPPFTVSLIGTIQPKIFRECFTGGNTHNGLLDRFMVAVNLDEAIHECALFQSWGQGVLSRYENYMYALIQEGNRPTGIIEFPDNCRDIAIDFNNWIVKFDNRIGCGASPKWRQQYFKVCSILANLWQSDIINREIAIKAADLTRYFVQSWGRAYKNMAKTDFAEVEDEVLGVVQSSGEITQRDVIRKFSSNKRRIVIESLESLIDDGVVSLYIDKAANGREINVYKSNIEKKEADAS